MQSRRLALIEATSSTLIGLAVGVIVQIIIFPFYGIEHVSTGEHVSMTVIFAATGLVRAYCVRRFFNWLERIGKNKSP